MTQDTQKSKPRLSVAPMMDWTDRHCRYFHRQISQTAELYTEMVTSAALVRGGALDLLDFNGCEHRVVLQLGGSDPQELAQAARMGALHGYDEINLNVGCPSDRVQSGTFGAVLMYHSELVGDCVNAMQEAVDIPISVKCRIGVDDQDPDVTLPFFLEHLQERGVGKVVVHARKAILKGLSPKENRTIPPLNYDLALKMREDFPDLELWVNGGIETLDEVQSFCDQGFYGAMIGRAAYHKPWQVLADLDKLAGQTTRAPSRGEIIEHMAQYADNHIAGGGRLHHITRHMLGLFNAEPGARHWRHALSTTAQGPDANGDTLRRVYNEVQERQAQAEPT